MAYTVPDILIYLVNNLFRIYIISILLRAFLDAVGERKIIVLRAACYMAFYAVNSMGFLCFDVPPYTNLMINVLGIALVAWTYGGSWKLKACIVFIVVGSNLIAENLVYRILLLTDAENIVAISLSVVNLLMFMLAIVIQKYVEARKGGVVELSEWAAVIALPGVSILLLGVIVDGYDNVMLVLTGDICLILFNVVVFYLFDRVLKIHKIQLEMEFLIQQNDAYQNQVRMLRQLDENLSILRHDMKNHLLVLQKMAEEGEMGELQAYLEKFLPSLESAGRFIATGNTAIDSLVNYKLSEITKDSDVEIKTEVSVSDQTGIDETDLSIILGNLLDNAASALKTCNAEKRLSLTIKEDRKILYIRIENTHSEELIKENSLFRSTKMNSGAHGLGLKSIRRIVEKNNGEISITDTESTFLVEIMLYIG